MSLDALLYFLAGWGTWCIIRDIVRLREATTKKENSNDGNG